METVEPPECPVCLQPYDAISAIPRVLTCGHTTCELCLKQMPNPFPNTVRCSICTALVRCPNPPSSLPKNLDLLHFSSTLQSHRPKDPTTTPRQNRDDQVLFPFTLKSSWSYELSRKWYKCIVPKDCISIEKVNDDEIVSGKASTSYDGNCWTNICGFMEKQLMGLVKVGIFSEGNEGSGFFRYSYVYRIMSVLLDMEEENRNKLEKILNLSLRMNNVGKAYGLWCNEDNNCVYIVLEKFDSPKLNDLFGKERANDTEKLSEDEIRGIASIGREICEIFCSLNMEGLVIGFLNQGCFSFNNFGRIRLDLFAIFSAPKGVAMILQRSRRNLEDYFKRDENFLFISPELLWRHLAEKKSDFDEGSTKYEVGYASDAWTLACLLVWLLVGSSFIQLLRSFLHSSVIALNDEGFDYLSTYMSTMGNISSLLDVRLGSEFTSLKEILIRCLDFNTQNRPAITEIWYCLCEFVIKPQFDVVRLLKPATEDETPGSFMILGEVFWKDPGEDENKELHIKGDFKCRELKGHLDCVSALTIRDGLLFSSSYDKTVKVWSLENFTCIHSFNGHEHRIMALVLVDGEEALCISGDYKGFICIWRAEFPFSESPIAKLDEKTDWRYSGIHSMAVSKREYLYTGGGDKLVKAWSLKDYSLSCTMSGHKAVITSLTVSHGVLYSGSWDGRIRLWSLSDHSALAVLGEDRVGDSSSSISSLFVENNVVVAGHENGMIKIWHDNVLVEHKQIHSGAVFSVCNKGRFLFSGGMDKTVNIQEMSREEEAGMESTHLVGSIPCDSTVTALVHSQGKLFVGQANRTIKVYQW